MTDLQKLLDQYVDDGTVPGAVALVARGDEVDVAVAGSVDVEGTAPMARDSIFRIASITKPIAAAAVMMLVDDGLVALDDPIATWLPELASPMVVRAPDAAVDDIVPAARPITVEDLLTFRAGWGFPDDFSLPAVRVLLDEVQDNSSAPDEWLATLAGVPMLHHPGEVWLYNTCSDVQGVLVSRVTGRSLPEFLAARLFEPLGMVDTGFTVPEAEAARFPSLYRPGEAGGLEPGEHGATWGSEPPFPSGAGGLVSTLDDWLAFARMLLAGGKVDGRRLLSAESVRRMTTDHLTPAQRDAGRLFLEGQGWGYGGSVDVADVDPWNVPGRYGWVGGTGTSAHIIPSTGTVAILLTQVAMTDPTPTPLMRDFWRAAT